MKYSLVFLLFLIVVSCTDPIPRRPISHHSDTFLKESVERNKHMNELEESAIKYYIAQDSLNVFNTSSNGFWFRYLVKVEDNRPHPKIGDEVVFEYEISDLNDEILYSYEKLGTVYYRIDKENIEAGLQSGLKLMKEGEEIMFLFPSYNAFGILGDKTKVGINQPLIYKVKLIKIELN